MPSTRCYEQNVMFLAKTWKTVNGRRYEAWVLKKSAWDPEEKRGKQVYLAYIGKTKSLSADKAEAICRKIGVDMEELRKVKGLRIETPAEDPVSEASIIQQEQPEEQQLEPDIVGESEDEPDVGFDVPDATPAEMVAQLRAHYGLDGTYEDYDTLAHKIGPLYVNAERLRMVEQDRAVLEGNAQERLRHAWRWATGGRT